MPTLLLQDESSPLPDSWFDLKGVKKQAGIEELVESNPPVSCSTECFLP